ncbi:MAG: phage major capsid protein [Euryarchaeota archaeon]|nr:phage major capsid protein [Euryarchaeota archaeon]
MTDYDQAIGRADPLGAGLIPTTYSREIIKEVIQTSVCLSLMKRRRNIPASIESIPVLETKPTAYFVGSEAVDGSSFSYDEGLLKTSKVEWGNVEIKAEKLGVEIPISLDTLEDMQASGYDVWGEIQPELTEAIAVAIDAAIIHGTNAPASWPNGIVEDATSKSHTVALGTGTDMYDDLMAESGVFSLVEDDGYNVRGWVADPSIKSRMRGLRTTDGVPIFTNPPQGSTTYALDGIAGVFVENEDSLDPASALLIAGDWSKGVYAWRQDMRFKVRTEGVITDNTGAVIYNLAQQDMAALKVTCRLGWQRPNPVNRKQSVAASRYPWAVLTPAGE